jgi:hypothetical protein
LMVRGKRLPGASVTEQGVFQAVRAASSGEEILRMT